MSRLRIVFASHTAELGFFTVGSHHLSRGLAARGHRVVHIASPLTGGHLAALGDAQVRARAAAGARGLHVESAHYATLVPVLAAPIRPAELIAHPGWWRTELRGGLAAARRFLGGRPDVVLIDQPVMSSLPAVLRAARTFVRSTDVVAEADKQRGFAAAVAGASGLIGTSAPALEQLAGFDARGLPRLLLANGVDYARFSAARRDWQQRRGCVYVGALDERFDWAGLGAAAAALPDEPFDIYGPAPASRPVLPDNVHVHGPLPYAEVPAVLGAHRVGLLPLVDSPANHGRSPMKLYEYLAAGLSVVASRAESLPRDLPGCRLVAMGAENGTEMGTEMAGAIAAALTDPPPAAAGQAARSMGWPARLDLLEEFIDAC